MKNHSIFLIFIIVGLTNLMAQVTVIPTIVPPFSPYFEDYLEFRNQEVLILVNNSRERLEVKLTARIEGDNGFYAFIRDDFQPANPIILEPLESRSLTPLSPEFGLFDLNAIESNVPQRQQNSVVASGILPEGNYTFCIQALDFQTSAPLSPPSPSGCLFVPISYMQPPVLLNPTCESSVFNRQPTFLWSPPIGNPGQSGFQYDLYIVKLNDGQEPNEAVNRAVEYRAGNPLIISDLSINHYVYRMADPSLEKGATYAMQVIAKDPEGVRQFENNGRSQVCTFTFDGNDPKKNTLGINQNLTNNGQGLFTQVSGQLRYYFQGKKGKQKDNELLLQKNATSQFLQKGEGKPGDAGLYQINSYEQPIFFDENLKSTKGTNPLANVKVKLVVRYILNGFENFKTGEKSYTSNGYLLPEDNHPYHPTDNGQTIAIAHTDENGNYRFLYSQADSMLLLKDFSTGLITNNWIATTSWGNQTPPKHSGDYFSQFKFVQLTKVLRLEVESPYYCSPEVNMLIQPGQSAQVPTQVSEVRSYHLQVKAFGDTIRDNLDQKHKPLEGLKIEILRATNTSSEIPEDEGKELGESGGKGWEVISNGETNKSGGILFSHLVLHDAYNSSDRYRIRASSKQLNTLDYYETDWKMYPVKTAYPMPDQPYTNQNIVYNSKFQPSSFKADISLLAGKPKIRGRVMQVANRADVPLDSVKVYLNLDHTQGKKDQYETTVIFTDAGGYFEFSDLPADHSGHISFYRYGYHHEMIPVPQLNMGDLFLPNDGLIKMTPLGKVYGYVSNESGEPIPADVKLADGPLSPTEYVSIPSIWENPKGKNRFEKPEGVMIEESNDNFQTIGIPKYRFIFGAQSGQNLPLRIEPFSDKYFPLDTVVNVEMKNDKGFNDKGDYQFLGEFHLKEKLHRVRFLIKDAKGKFISGAKIEIQDTVLLAGKGIRKYAFASPSQFFLVKVIPPKNSNFITWYEEVEIPISPVYQDLEIILKKGATIRGIVTAGLDSMPLSGARVFVKSDFVWNNDFPISETTSDENGEFTLHGVPIDTVYKASLGAVPVNVEIHAVKSDPQISYVGDKKFVKVPFKGHVKLHLQTVENLNLTHLWGLPIEIEEFDQNSSGGGKLTGAFVNLPENENFSLQDQNVRLSFQNIDIEPGNKTDAKGIAIARPLNEEIITDQTSLIVDVYNQFTGKMYSRDYYSYEKGAERIVVGHDGADHGLIHGNVGILLSSFNFSYQYQGKFILADNPNNTIIPVFSASNIPKQSYNLVDYKRGGKLKDASFKVHNFHAHADRTKSFIRDDSVHLFTVLHTNIPDSKPADLKIQAGEIVVLPDNILPFSGGKKLSFKLEEWEVVSQSSWSYNKNLGAIFISKALVHTGVIDIPIEHIRLQPDDLDIDNPDLQKSGLSLGGVVPLKVYTSNFVFGYDTKCGSDLKPHWKLRLINEGDEPVAMFTGLPGAENHEIFLDHITLYSNGEQVVGGLDEKVRFYDIMTMSLDQIATGNGFFKIRGRVDLGIPQVSKDISTDFTYTNGANGKINFQWEPLSFILDTKGKVEFQTESVNQLLLNGMFATPGKIRIYSPDGEIHLKGQLMRTANSCRISVVKINGEHQSIELGNPNNRMVILQGKTEVNLTNDTWGLFSFDARMEGFKGIGEGDNEMTFIVEGDIKATDQDISITDINTPLGGIQLIYNFKEQFLFGSMHVNKLGMGSVEIQQGDFQILMDKRGYYFLVGATVTVPIVNTIGMAVLIGDYPEFTDVMRSTFENYAYNHNIPKGFEDGFSGFLLNGKWENSLFNNDGIDIGVFSVYASATVGLDLRVSADFSSDAFEIYVLGFGNFGLEISAFCVTGFFVLNAELGIGAQIVNGNFDLVGCASIQVGVGFEACVPLDPLAIFCLDACISDCWTGSIKADLLWGESSTIPSFDISFGETCSNNQDAMSIGNKSGNPCN